MSEQGKWTPGPWQWKVGKPFIMGSKIHPANGNKYWVDVAQVAPQKAAAFRGGCDEESSANVRLIAAAPETIKRLEVTARELHKHHTHWPTLEECHVEICIKNVTILRKAGAL